VSYTRPGANGITEKVSLNFNICEATNRDCSNEESNEDDFANIKINSKCKHLSDSALSEVDVNLIDEEDPSRGLILSYTGGDKIIPWQIVSQFLGSKLVDIRYQQLLPYIQPKEGEAFRDQDTGTIYFVKNGRWYMKG
jgi:hypothetical protein